MAYQNYADKTPPINAAGKYILRTPWAVDPTVSYKCEAISGFEALEERYIKVFEQYYAPYDIEHAQYEGDRSKGINIVTLMSNSGETVYVPSSFIIYYPGDTSISYGRIIIAIDCGPLPTDFPLSDVMSELVSTATGYIGNSGITASVHIAPMKGFVDSQLNKNLSSSRWDNISNTVTGVLKNITDVKTLQKANTKISSLEELLS